MPIEIGLLGKLKVLNVGHNKLVGGIPSFLGNLSSLLILSLTNNNFEGEVPHLLCHLKSMKEIYVSSNNLTGTFPSCLYNISSLTIISTSLNQFHGSLPPNMFHTLSNLRELYIAGNQVSGHIPGTIGECIMLEYLYMRGNLLQGIIPSSFASLKGLRHLDLSRNRLSGSIPNFLQNISFLEYFNVSFNMLDGEIPTEGFFRNAIESVVAGNNKLCGGIAELHRPHCSVKGKKLAKLHKFRSIEVIVSAVAFLFILSIILTIYWMRKRSKKPYLVSPIIDQLAKVSYQRLYNGTNGFSTTSLIGSGNFSSVYKGTLELVDEVVAIKVLNLQKKGAHKSFIVECNALQNIKHRNLVQILTCCSSIYYKGQEFKALIFEYMENGSLEQWLYPKTLSTEHPRTLNLDQRLNIMIDVASALHYLHHECDQPIIHCDLKPSNVLLDDDMIAHVSDFGITRLLSTINGTTSNQTSTIGIKGTVGYTAPETCIALGFLCWKCLLEEGPLMKSLKMVKTCITLQKIHFLIILYKFWTRHLYQNKDKRQ
ncbi:probable LRR receptor-like serine/threonine-protein kinase At3g47570 isoform X2 [Cajanus cajan]|uniref:probable LRR receptor-like serine/threonine-protein kinase At3g47570 isoform X2 n=1 Tax=Cajanus cajan TaxID=3821 RepID=UPI00098D8DA1|nr:probable LRR receptor-like serine/threonine-protein kinase At3g47570 isoform X2 [Cajanus cajan]